MKLITESVGLSMTDGITVLTVNHPPVNALGISVRKGVAMGVAQAAKDPEAAAILMICEGKTFFAGADIREFGNPLEAPTLAEVVSVIESSGKPVISAIHGTALGGGLETALACHYRVAASSARLGLPEVKLGLIPGAGGTQRLPRLVGPEKALDMIVSGNPIGAREALEIGLIDAIVEGDLRGGAIDFAKKIIQEDRPLRRVSELCEKVAAARGNMAIFDNFRKSILHKTRGFEAPEACVKAVESAVNLTFKEGLAFERELFSTLMAGSQSKAQRHYFFAEREVAKVSDIPRETPVRDIKKAAVIGAGTMGGGITMNFVNAGISVVLVEARQDLLDRGLSVIRKNYEITASKGKMTEADVEKKMALIQGNVSLESVAEADIVIEAVYENMDLKKEIFGKLDRICKPDAIMATNTSYLDVNEIAAMTTRPENVLGLHFFSPANVMRLMEIVRGEKTAKPVLATALSLASKIKKIPVVVGVCYGFAGNRMFAKREREVEKLILEGALPSQIDRVIYTFGFPMGPIALRDLIGIDLGWNPEKSTGSTIREVLCEMGRFGLKSGSGYYRYEKGSRTPIPDPEIEKLIVDFSAKKNINRREISDEEILQRCVYPIINEGAKILEEKIVERASDLDVIWVNGYGWPVYLGGPMFYADQVGLDKILEALKGFEKRFGEEWTPAPLIEKLVREGKGFKDIG